MRDERGMKRTENGTDCTCGRYDAMTQVLVIRSYRFCLEIVRTAY